MTAFIADDKYTACLSMSLSEGEEFDFISSERVESIVLHAAYAGNNPKISIKSHTKGLTLSDSQLEDNFKISAQSHDSRRNIYKYTLTFDPSGSATSDIRSAVEKNGFISEIYEFKLTFNDSEIVNTCRLLLRASISGSGFATDWNIPVYREQEDTDKRENGIEFKDDVLTTKYAYPRQKGDYVFTLVEDITKTVEVDVNGNTTTAVATDDDAAVFNYAPPTIGDPILYVAQPSEKLLNGGYSMNLVAGASGLGHALKVTGNNNYLAVGVAAKPIEEVWEGDGIDEDRVFVGYTGTHNTTVDKRCKKGALLDFIGNTCTDGSIVHAIIGHSMQWPDRYPIQRTVHQTDTPTVSVNHVGKYGKGQKRGAYILDELRLSCSMSLNVNKDIYAGEKYVSSKDHDSDTAYALSSDERPWGVEFSKDELCPIYVPESGYTYLGYKPYDSLSLFETNRTSKTEVDKRKRDDFDNKDNNINTYSKIVENTGVRIDYKEASGFDSSIEKSEENSQGFSRCAVVLGQHGKDRYNDAYNIAALPAACNVSINASKSLYAYTKDENGESTDPDKEPEVKTTSVTAHNVADNISQSESFHVDSGADDIAYTSEPDADDASGGYPGTLTLSWRGCSLRVTFSWGYMRTYSKTTKDAQGRVVGYKTKSVCKYKSLVYETNYSPSLNIAINSDGVRTETEYGPSEGFRDFREEVEYSRTSTSSTYTNYSGNTPSSSGGTNSDSLSISCLGHRAVSAGSAAPTYNTETLGSVTIDRYKDKKETTITEELDESNPLAPNTYKRVTKIKITPENSYDIYKGVRKGSGSWTRSWKVDYENSDNDKYEVNIGEQEGCIHIEKYENNWVDPNMYEDLKAWDLTLVRPATKASTEEESENIETKTSPSWTTLKTIIDTKQQLYGEFMQNLKTEFDGLVNDVASKVEWPSDDTSEEWDTVTTYGYTYPPGKTIDQAAYLRTFIYTPGGNGECQLTANCTAFDRTTT